MHHFDTREVLAHLAEADHRRVQTAEIRANANSLDHGRRGAQGKPRLLNIEPHRMPQMPGQSPAPAQRKMLANTPVQTGASPSDARAHA